MQHPDETTDPTQPSAAIRPTGLPAADRVLEAVAGLDDRPVDDHVAVFEQAHDQLRRALDARPDS
jgi:hypothetical protein